MSAKLFQNDYARMFYPKARGYTPMNPDVRYAGINITKGADDPRNWQSLPKDYEPCSLELGVDYTIDASRYPSPSVVSGAEFELNPITRAQPDDVERFKFSTSAAQGAYCALPFGGSSYECTASGIAKLRHDNLDIQNGDLAVVTGCEKTSYWTCGLFSSAGPNSRLTKTLCIPEVREGIAEERYIVESCPSESTQMAVDFWLQSGRAGATYMLENQPACFAFRGFYISLKASIYNDIKMPWGIRKSLWHALPKVLRPPTRSWPLRMRSCAPASLHWRLSSRTEQLIRAISLIIQRQDTRVKIVVVHDNDILSVIEPHESFLPNDAEVARRMMARYVVLADSAGRAFLQDKNDVKLSKWERFQLNPSRKFISVRREHIVHQ
ncbi:hypothetical protein CPB85DRAFT_1255364 [Mucidula mucida]|nr:hypothetical protein CPB85DRAFT_1255364 [Mucidula mucida]